MLTKDLVLQFIMCIRLFFSIKHMRMVICDQTKSHLTQWMRWKCLLLPKSDQWKCLRKDTRTLKNIVIVPWNSYLYPRPLPHSGTPGAMMSLNSTRTEFLHDCNPPMAFCEPKDTHSMHISVWEHNNPGSKLLESVWFYHKIFKKTFFFPKFPRD